jgi:hypothetical protein
MVLQTDQPQQRNVMTERAGGKQAASMKQI